MSILIKIKLIRILKILSHYAIMMTVVIVAIQKRDYQSRVKRRHTLSKTKGEHL